MTKFREVVTSFRGGSAFLKEEYVAKGAPVITKGDIKQFGRLQFSENKFIDPFYAKEKGFPFTQDDDLVVATRDLSVAADFLGLVAAVPNGKKFLVNQGANIFTLNAAKVRKEYFVYWTNSNIYRSHIRGAAVGSTQVHLRKDDFLDAPLLLPSLEEQDQLIRILSPLDKKIDLNRQINQTLEQIAQAMFKSWFVDFEPTRAKIAAKEAGGDQAAIEQAAMCAISGKTPDQLNQSPPETLAQLKATAALFPDSLVDSELGEIPEGWEVKALSSIIDIIGGGTPKRSEETYWNGDIPWFSVRDVPASGDIFVVDTEEKISKLGLQKSSTKLLPVGTTIISARGTVGKLALVGTPMCMNQSCYGIRGKDGFGAFFTYFNLREAVDTLLRNVHGAVFDTITTQTFESYSMAVSTEGLTKQFDVCVEPLLNRIDLNVRENITLSHLRDSLLPKLLSGDFEFNQCKTIA